MRVNFRKIIIAGVAVGLSISLYPDAKVKGQSNTTGAFEGVFVDGQTGEPLEGVVVEIVDQHTSEALRRRTDAGGRFYQGLLHPGMYKLRYSKEGYKSREYVGRVVVASTSSVLPIPIQMERDPAVRAPSPTLSAPLGAWPESAKRFALLIGVDHYSDSHLNPLKGGANDAKALASALVRYAGFPHDQVVVLSSGEPAERQPTRSNILRRLSNFRNMVPKDGLLLISFAGHGIEREDHAFLLPSDVQMISGDVDLLEDTAIDAPKLMEQIKKIGVNQVIMILDTCRNDPIDTGRGIGLSEVTLSKAFPRELSYDARNQSIRAFATLFATQPGSSAYEYTEKKQGYFSWALVDGLSGGASNEGGEVTLGGLTKFVEENVAKQVSLDLGPGHDQKPWAEVVGYLANDLVIARASTPKVVAATDATGSLFVVIIEPNAVVKIDPIAGGTTYKDITSSEKHLLVFSKVRPGRYRVIGSLAGHAPVVCEVEIARNEAHTVELAFRTRTCK